MLEALWSVKFASNGSYLPGGGIVVLETGRVLGGDPWFLFVGDFSVKDDVLKARVKVTQYEKFPPGVGSITGLTNYTGVFEGKVDQNLMTLNGHVDGQPHIKILLEMRRRAELP